MARYDHTAVWTKGGNPETMILWGGIGFDSVAMANTPLNDGAVYDPKSTWAPVSATALPPRSQATAVWTGASMLIWGGVDGAGAPLGDGSKYVNGTWYTISNAAAPSPRTGHSAAMIKAMAGNRMIVWGGVNGATYLNSGALLEESMLDWSPMPTAPIARAHHSAVIVGGSGGTIGSKMIIWGGDISGGLTDSGAIYDASTM